MKSKSPLIALFSILSVTAAYGAVSSVSDTSSSSFTSLPWPSRVTGWGMGGDYGMGMGDAMVPLLGNQDAMIYADVQGKYSADKSWVGSIGAGYRQVYNCERILGAYLFFDGNDYYNHPNLATTSQRDTFWFVSPGVESMGNDWDLRLNGYIPISNERTSSTEFGDQFGNFNSVVFRGHQQFDQVFNVENIAGTNGGTGLGVDGEVGRIIRIPGMVNQPRVYVGGYYFSPRDVKNITGVSGRVELPLAHQVAVVASDSYDNYFHNSAEVGLRFTLGGLSDDQSGHDIERRMLDPISRNLATLSSTQGTAEPVVATRVINQASTREVLERDNIYFFTGMGGTTYVVGGGTSNCTFEHPCTAASFNQTDVNDISTFVNGANLYFNPGNYTANNGIVGDPLVLPGGQSMFGRTPNYALPATLVLPQFVGGLELDAGNNLLDSFALTNTNNPHPIIAVNSNNVTMNNLAVTLINLDSAFFNGISLSNAQNILINNSRILIESLDGNGVTGIMVGGSSLTVNNSNIATEFSGSASGNVVEDIMGSGSVININNSAVTASWMPFNGVPFTAGIEVTGVVSSSGSVITINNSNISAYADSGSRTSIGGNIISADAVDAVNSSTVTVVNSALTAAAHTLANDAMSVGANGISAFFGTINIANDTINASAIAPNATSPTTVSAIGVNNAGSSVLNVFGPIFYNIIALGGPGSIVTQANTFGF